MTRKNIRNLTGGFSELQSKIILLRGFADEGVLMQQKHFADQLKKSFTTVNYNILKLRKKGILTDLNLLTPDGKAVFQKLKGYLNNTKKLRGHKISGSFVLKEPYCDFENVKDHYLKISGSPKHRGFRLDFKGCVVLFYTPVKIVFYLPDVYGDSIEEVYVCAYDEWIKTLKGYLEQLFPRLRIDDYVIASVQVNHLAYVHHPLAKIFKEFSVHYVSDRLEVDHSHGVPELETVHKKYAVEDMDKILDYEKVVRGSFNGNEESGNAQ